MSEDEFKNRIKIQFEINQRLEIDLLLCRESPHYLISQYIPYLDAATILNVTSLIDEKGNLLGDLAVNVVESASSLKTDAHTVLFSSQENHIQELKVFRDEAGNSEALTTGLISELPPFPISGKHNFYFQFHNPKSNKWELIGELPQPEIKSEYPCKYYVTLSAKGLIRVHAFEVPYWESANSEDLQKEGCVFRDTLQAQPNDIEVKRDPFSGEH
jgi:hypothetical protein